MLLKPDRLKLDYLAGLNGVADLEHWQPENPWDVDLHFELGIRWDNWDQTFEIFSSRLRTYGLRERVQERKGPVIYMEKFDFSALQENVLHLIAKSERLTWDESLRELRKHFKWQYEGCNWV
jgi:hypothetical protein